MITAYYYSTFGLSLLLSLVYSFKWHKHYDLNVSVVFILVPISILSDLFIDRASTLEELVLGIKMSYIGGVFLMTFVLMVVLNICHIRIARWMRAGLFSISSVIFLTSMTIGSSTIFYNDIRVSSVGRNLTVTKEYGPMHTVSRIWIILQMLMCFLAIIYSYFKKKQVSRKMIYLLFLPAVVSAISFFGGRKMVEGVELVPAAYVFAQVVYLIIVSKLSLYDVSDTAIDSMVQEGATGFISFDFKYNYLSSNETAKNIFPELNELTVDKPIENSDFMKQTALKWLTGFCEDQTKDRAYFVRDDKTYLVTITYLFDGRRKRGYQLFITDDTQNQQYIKLLNSFNSELKSEVAEKTRHIEEMHDNLVLSMATMVESRDNSTGGHIKRTSVGVRLLIEEMKKDPGNDLSEEFCHDIIKAAPMHDLGKIAVDDRILRKPGRFTPEEFEQMKVHSAEGARIVHEILKGTDDLKFHLIAENVAHYHHERWDGSGYPEGLKGGQIPLEARIMAIADVYDALVSKRVYKEKMSFEDADKIIMESFGKHFDKSLEKYYVKARPKLEEYYSTLEEHK
ncbi:MAG: HD domain-containing protein [Ruminococcus sp.]|nr:HD domain-containing protein [Ruminococcus sp.]